MTSYPPITAHLPPRQQLLVGADRVLALVIAQRVGLLSRGQYSDVMCDVLGQESGTFRNHQSPEK